MKNVLLMLTAFGMVCGAIVKVHGKLGLLLMSILFARKAKTQPKSSEAQLVDWMKREAFNKKASESASSRQKAAAEEAAIEKEKAARQAAWNKMKRAR